MLIIYTLYLFLEGFIWLPTIIPGIAAKVLKKILNIVFKCRFILIRDKFIMNKCQSGYTISYGAHFWKKFSVRLV